MDIIRTFKTIVTQQETLSWKDEDVSQSQQPLSMPVATIKALSETLQHSQGITKNIF